MLTEFAQKPAGETGVQPILIKSEQDILARVAQGESTKEIAKSQHIAETTVKSQVSNILGKLQAENRTQAGGIARWYGLAVSFLQQGSLRPVILLI